MSDQQPQSITPVSDALRASGNWNPAWDGLADLDAGYTERFVAMGAHAMQNCGLDALTIELIAIAVDASCTHM